MRTYNKYISILLLCGTVIFSSCSKWLDVQPKTSIKSDELLNSEEGFKEALIGIYISMSSSNTYGKELSFGFVDVLAAQYEVPSGQEYYNTQLYSYKAINTFGKKDGIWATQYNTITNINNILNTIDEKQAIMSPILYRIMKGELLGLRAFLHLDLMRLYGYGDLKHRPELMSKMTIPYATKYSKDFIPQKSYKETIALIEKDLLEALTYLKEDPAFDDKNRPEGYFKAVNTDGFLDKRDDRFNYWAATATLARLYYWIGDHKNALIYSEEVINSKSWSWISKYSISTSDLKSRDLTFMSEQMFSLRTVKYADIVNKYFIANTGSGTMTTNHMLFRSETKHKELYEISSSIGITDYRYLYLYSVADKRAFPEKLIQREDANLNYSARIPMIRISEMYIIAIDAMINGTETVNLPKAIEYFNTYRNARGIKIVYDPASSTSLLNAELEKEMRKEFFCEGQLFYFYKRLNYDKLPGATVVMTDKNYVVPYPDDEITYGKRVQ